MVNNCLEFSSACIVCLYLKLCSLHDHIVITDPLTEVHVTDVHTFV